MTRIQSFRGAILSSLLLIAIFVPTSLFAQLDTGAITGTVIDASGAVVPGAKITLTNTDTSVQQTMESTSTGTYDFTGVRPGTYSLRAEAAGFQAFVDDGLLIHVQQTVTVDVHFVTGQVTQEVTVTASAPLLQAENAAVGQTVTTQAVNDLPLQTRDWASLAQLSAGVTTAPVGNPSSDSGQTSSAFYAVNGVDTWQNDYRLNGINDNIEMYGGSSVGSDAAITPPPDAIQEFKLQSGNADAEFGHSTGAVTNAALKSGTNSFHGDAWEYWRNDVITILRPRFFPPAPIRNSLCRSKASPATRLTKLRTRIATTIPYRRPISINLVTDSLCFSITPTAGV
jgi:hypothetical protein